MVEYYTVWKNGELDLNVWIVERAPRYIIEQTKQNAEEHYVQDDSICANKT